MLGRHLVDHPFLSNVMSLCFLTHIRFSFTAPDKAQFEFCSRSSLCFVPCASIYTTRVRTAFLRKCSWKCKSRRAVPATTACCWPSNFEATRQYQSAESIATKKCRLLSFDKASCKSISGFGSATLKEIGIAKGVAQTVRLGFAPLELTGRIRRTASWP